MQPVKVQEIQLASHFVQEEVAATKKYPTQHPVQVTVLFDPVAVQVRQTFPDYVH